MPRLPSARIVISFSRYASVLADSDLRRIWAVSLLGRLPIGITGLAILLLVQTASGSFVYGGTASGCYLAGLAFVAPAIGRAIDKFGPRLVLLLSAFAFPTALVALSFAVTLQAHVTVVLTLSACAGASFPPITVCMRTYLRRRVADESSLAVAYSIESILIELIFILGPALVAMFVALASAGLAVLFAAACGTIGTFLFLASPTLKSWSILERRSAGILGPLARPGFTPLVAIILCYSCAFGLLEIGVVAYAAARGTPGLAGVLLALMSVGSAIGGLVYGSRHWHVPLARQFCIALALMGIGLLALTIRWPAPAFAAGCAIAGLVMAPALIIQSMLVAKISRADHLTEAFTWSTSALLAGVGGGLTVGGALLDRWDWRAPIAAAAAMAIAAALAGSALLGNRGLAASGES